MNSYTKQQRLDCITQMIDSADKLVSFLKQDLANYNCPGREHINTRLMLSRSWIKDKIKKYSCIAERLHQSLDQASNNFC